MKMSTTAVALTTVMAPQQQLSQAPADASGQTFHHYGIGQRKIFWLSLEKAVDLRAREIPLVRAIFRHLRAMSRYRWTRVMKPLRCGKKFTLFS